MIQTKQLTDFQLNQYHEQGYVLVEDVFPVAELAAIDVELDAYMQSHPVEPHSDNPRGWLLRLGLCVESAQAFCEDPRILSLIDRIVHPGIAIYSAKLVSKEPLCDDICHWHQDDAYYTQQSQSEHRMSVWIPLQDTTIEQGALQVIPASHKRGLQPASVRETGTCTLAMDVDVDVENRIHVPVKAGDMLLFSSLLWHASDGNATSRRRRALIVSYQEATVPRGNGAQWKILRPA